MGSLDAVSLQSELWRILTTTLTASFSLSSYAFNICESRARFALISAAGRFDEMRRQVDVVTRAWAEQRPVVDVDELRGGLCYSSDGVALPMYTIPGPDALAELGAVACAVLSPWSAYVPTLELDGSSLRIKSIRGP